jgi:hypothetical protein
MPRVRSEGFTHRAGETLKHCEGFVNMHKITARLTTTFQRDQHWVCQNLNCGPEIIVRVGSKLKDEGKPRCTCGSVMISSLIGEALKAATVLREKSS